MSTYTSIIAPADADNVELTVCWPNGTTSTLTADQPPKPAKRGFFYGSAVGISYTAHALGTTVHHLNGEHIQFGWWPVFGKCMVDPTTGGWLRGGWDTP